MELVKSEDMTFLARKEGAKKCEPLGPYIRSTKKGRSGGRAPLLDFLPVLSGIISGFFLCLFERFNASFYWSNVGM